MIRQYGRKPKDTKGLPVRYTPKQLRRVQQIWAKKLRNEGLHVLANLSDHADNDMFVRLPGDLETFAVENQVRNDTWEYWYRFEHEANALPSGFPGKKFLIHLSQTGYLSDSCKEFGIDRLAGRKLVEFMDKMIQWRENHARDSQAD